jgi:hypothetical protein
MAIEPVCPNCGQSIPAESALREQAEKAVRSPAVPGSPSDDPLAAQLPTETGSLFLRPDGPHLIQSHASAEVEIPGSTPGRSNRPSIQLLLASYASAITLLLVGLLVRDAMRGQADHPSRSTHASGSQKTAAASRRQWLAQLKPIPESNRIPLGQTRIVGDLEITPVDIMLATIYLDHVPGSAPPRWGGDQTIELKLRITNRSKSAKITPLARASFRTPDHGDPKSLIENGTDHPLTNFPLPVASEWTVSGETFAELAPGDSAEFLVHSEPDAKSSVTDQMLWRFPVQCGIDRVEWIGVSFRRADLE